MRRWSLAFPKSSSILSWCELMLRSQVRSYGSRRNYTFPIYARTSCCCYLSPHAYLLRRYVKSTVV